MFDFKNIEKKWIKYWDENETFKTDVWDFSKPKFYALDMFPYPSAQGLHVGHPEGYTATDIVARMKKMQGYNVLHPMGFDSFGLPAEQFAIKTGNHPLVFTQKNMRNFIFQLKMIGLSYDWSKQISTDDPKFFKWTQKIFKLFFEAGLTSYENFPVNWCEELGTVLSNDEVINGKSERGGFPVIKKNMKQWVINIPAYAEKLIEGLDELDWPESTKENQRNWIGKSEGAKVTFKVKGADKSFEVFTTRIDTLFGATYAVLAPEKALVLEITSKEQRQAVEDYIKTTTFKNDIERTDLNKDKTGVFIGAYAINPANEKEIPIYIADYVLDSYGTGAIMAVPAHDERDYDFAKKFNLPIIPVLEGGDISQEAFTGDGKHINSSFLDGLNKEDAIKKMLEVLGQKGLAEKTINYRLREWVFARQRYWGEPMPIVHLENGKMVALKDEELPLDLPELDDYKPLKGGMSPLEKASSWVNVEVDGIKGKRETSTMPSTAGSSWYFLRYIDPHNDKEIADKQLLKHWLPVDLYVGGAEHTVGHLLYARFFTNFLYDKGIVPVKEPFKKLVHQGMILGENGEKMSKSKGNVVNPNDIIEEFGADAFRLYEMFMGPISASKPWNTKNIAASKKFLDRVYVLFTSGVVKDQKNPNLDKVYHATVKKVTNDYENLAFNTAISQLMIFINACYKEEVVPAEYAKGFVKMLNPIAPFVTEEMWQNVFNEQGSISNSTWPVYDEKYLLEDEYKLPIQINGKLKSFITVSNDLEKDEIIKLILSEEVIVKTLNGQTPKNIIVVPKRIANIIM